MFCCQGLRLRPILVVSLFEKGYVCASRSMLPPPGLSILRLPITAVSTLLPQTPPTGLTGFQGGRGCVGCSSSTCRHTHSGFETSPSLSSFFSLSHKLLLRNLRLLFTRFHVFGKVFYCIKAASGGVIRTICCEPSRELSQWQKPDALCVNMLSHKKPPVHNLH